MTDSPDGIKGCDLLTEAEAAALLHLSPDTLRQWRTGKRHAGKAPAYIQQGKGRVLYLRADLEAWLLRNRRVAEPTGEGYA